MNECVNFQPDNSSRILIIALQHPLSQPLALINSLASQESLIAYQIQLPATAKQFQNRSPQGLNFFGMPPILYITEENFKYSLNQTLPC
jgi:hypothetical protein